MNALETEGPFIATREHRRFVEFANAVRKQRYIGLCYGNAGVGKTVSARRYAHWDLVEPVLGNWALERDNPERSPVNAALSRSRTVFHTPPVMGSLRALREQLTTDIIRVETCIDDHLFRDHQGCRIIGNSDYLELLVFDEAERLSLTALEFIRDIFDRRKIGVILIGMPGMEKRLSRFPQLYSRIGFAHHYKPLQGEELTFVLTRHWRQFGLTPDVADFTDAQAMVAVARITGGNFRLLQRLFVQIGRIMEINSLSMVSEEVVNAARNTLVIGSP